ncbi:hypothetical protein M0804_014193 [Polistes exclamans]|nr:hypothetical protein M0804_014198 [Polistes exclamans]KAI4475612.1 hypothetical protein M0804_014193 [Polistes exclamans]
MVRDVPKTVNNRLFSWTSGIKTSKRANKRPTDAEGRQPQDEGELREIVTASQNVPTFVGWFVADVVAGVCNVGVRVVLPLLVVLVMFLSIGMGDSDSSCRSSSTAMEFTRSS